MRGDSVYILMTIKTQLPEIRMRYAWHIDNAFDAFLAKVPESEKEDYVIENRKEVEEKITLFESVWKKVEEKILFAMCDILELSFYPKIVDVYVSGTFKKAFSTPLVISSKYTPELFVDVLTHELLHVLLTDNNKKVDVRKAWNEMFPESIDRTSRNHVLVHAVHKEIYLNTMNAPEKLAFDIEKCKKFKGYEDAWNIVEKRGHMEIINEFKKYYAKT